jgi:ketosteroid isomerase-like protein
VSRENVEVVLSSLEAWNRGDLSAWLESLAPDVVVAFPPEVPEPGPFHGREEVREWAEGFVLSWNNYSIEIEKLVEVDDRVVVVARESGRGKESGVPFEGRDGFVFRIRDGKIIELRNYAKPAAAFEAVGLRE